MLASSCYYRAAILVMNIAGSLDIRAGASIEERLIRERVGRTLNLESRSNI